MVLPILLVALVPGAARADGLERCQTVEPDGASFERHWDCGGERGPGKSFDYLSFLIDDPDAGYDGMVWAIDLPSQSGTFPGGMRVYAWMTDIFDEATHQSRYERWDLLSGGKRCWDTSQRPGFAIEVDPAMCDQAD
jgi:hypothetical protein